MSSDFNILMTAIITFALCVIFNNNVRIQQLPKYYLNKCLTRLRYGIRDLPTLLIDMRKEGISLY